MLQIGPWCPLWVSIFLLALIISQGSSRLTNLLLSIEVVNLSPSVLLDTTTSDKLALLWVNGNGCDDVRQINLLQELSCVLSSVKVHRLAGCNSQDRETTTNIGMRCSNRELVELARANRPLNLQLLNNRALSKIPPSDEAILTCGNKHIWVMGPDDGLDLTLVDTDTDLET